MSALALTLCSSCRGEGIVSRQPPAIAEVEATRATGSARVITQALRSRSEFEATGEGSNGRDPLARVEPPEQPGQSLAFSRHRFAAIENETLVVMTVPDFTSVATISVPDARNVISPVGGGFLVAGRDAVYRMSELDRRAERLPRAPRLGPTTMLPSLIDAQQFWLSYEGIPTLPLFDLGAEPRTSPLLVVGWTPLPAFDRRALLAFGDGSVVYTVPDGLHRIDAEGRHERLPMAEIAGRVWRLARSSRWDRVWAAARDHVYLLTARGAPVTLQRIDLPPHAVAVASFDRKLAVLSVEGMQADFARLRLDVHTQGAGPAQVFRANDFPGPTGGVRGTARFLPELAFAPPGDLLAVRGFGLHVFDWQRGTQIYPAPPPQNLANIAP
jgi:hypothetical protein